MKDIIGRHLSRIRIRNHPILKDVDLDLINPNTGKPYDVVAFVGENGCGKTTLLNELFNYDNSEYIVDKESTERPHTALYLRQGSVHSNALKEVRKLIDGKDMYPSSSYKDPLWNCRLWNNKHILDIVGQLEDEQVCALVADNHLDDIACSGEVSKLIDGKEHGYNITSYSSGQQEVLLKLKDLQDLAYDDFLLLDEPETSLHPRWQKQIVGLIKKMVDKEHGQIPQIFLATHSEKVLESLMDDENALIVRLYKNKGVIKHQSINKMNLTLPRTTFAELDYIIFNIPSFEYSNELFGYLGDLFNTDSVMKIDKKFEIYAKKYLGRTNAEKLVKVRRIEYHGETRETRMLPTYIRDTYHHSDRSSKIKEVELKESIDSLRYIIKSIIAENKSKE